MTRDSNMRVGRITSREISERLCACSDVRWHKGENDLNDVYEKNGPITIKDTLEGKGISNLLDREEPSITDVYHAAEIIFVVLDPAIVGQRVFLLMLADIAETCLEDFENSEFDSPEPRDMVDAIRSLAFGTLKPEDVKEKSEAAYEGENSRADIYYYGELAVEVPESSRFRDLQGFIFTKLKQDRALERLKEIIDRMKEYDTGAVDLTNEFTSRPRPRQDT